MNQEFDIQQAYIDRLKQRFAAQVANLEDQIAQAEAVLQLRSREIENLKHQLDHANGTADHSHDEAPATPLEPISVEAEVDVPTEQEN